LSVYIFVRMTPTLLDLYAIFRSCLGRTHSRNKTVRGYAVHRNTIIWYPDFKLSIQNVYCFISYTRKRDKQLHFNSVTYLRAQCARAYVCLLIINVNKNDVMGPNYWKYQYNHNRLQFGIEILSAHACNKTKCILLHILEITKHAAFVAYGV